MKTLKAIIPVIALFFFINIAGAKANDNEKLSKNYAVNTYIDAVTHGKIAGFNEVLANDIKFCVLQGKNVVNYSSKQMLDHLAGLKNIQQTCTTTTSVVEDNEEVAVVKVDMQYATFTRSNYITIANTGTGWKITNVCSVFK